jgi:XTP/dITP diphosphohydrolase
VVATSNPGKLAEIGAILADLPLVLRPLGEFPGVTLPDEGADYESNAVHKARAAARGAGRLALGDDSGLEVDALSGAPGPRSARYGGVELSDRERTRKLLEALKDVPEAQRGARFVCVAALATPTGDVVVARGECAGSILAEPRGSAGFGYDPVFRVRGMPTSMAELPAVEKNRISHRARAFRGLVPDIERLAKL